MMSFLQEIMENNYESVKRLNKKKRDLEVDIERQKIKVTETTMLKQQLTSQFKLSGQDYKNQNQKHYCLTDQVRELEEQINNFKKRKFEKDMEF